MMFTLAIFNQHGARGSNQSHQARKRKKMHLSKKEEVKLFADGLMLYIGNPGNSTRKLLELINRFSQIAGYKINIQKSPIFLCVHNKLSEKLRKQSYLLYHTKKYLISLTKEVKDTENYDADERY